MRKFAYGWKRQFPDKRDKRFAAEFDFVHLSLPEKVDLREIASCEVYDQGRLGSCTANALAFLCEYDWLKQKKADPFTPSRLFIYWNERFLEHSVHFDSGAMLRDGIKALHKWGFCPEDIWPYHIYAFAHKPSMHAYAEAKKERILDYLAVSQSLSEMKSALAMSFPIVIGFSVYESFESPEVAHSGIVSLPASNETQVGGHAVAIIGYDDSSERFLVRNSWGKDWGMEGHFTIPYAYFTDPDLASDLWVVRMVP